MEGDFCHRPSASLRVVGRHTGTASHEVTWGSGNSASASPTSLPSSYSDIKFECSSGVLECGGSRLERAHDKAGVAAHACNAGTLHRLCQTAQKLKVTLSYIRVSGQLGLRDLSQKTDGTEEMARRKCSCCIHMRTEFRSQAVMQKLQTSVKQVQ